MAFKTSFFLLCFLIISSFSQVWATSVVEFSLSSPLSSSYHPITGELFLDQEHKGHINQAISLKMGYFYHWSAFPLFVGGDLKLGSFQSFHQWRDAYGVTTEGKFSEREAGMRLYAGYLAPLLWTPYLFVGTGERAYNITSFMMVDKEIATNGEVMGHEDFSYGVGLKYTHPLQGAFFLGGKAEYAHIKRHYHLIDYTWDVPVNSYELTVCAGYKKLSFEPSYTYEDERGVFGMKTHQFALTLTYSL